MNAAVLAGLVEQWLWRCELVATEYQLRPSIDLKLEVEKLVGEAEAQAELLQVMGATFLARIECRLALMAHIAAIADPFPSEPPADPALNASRRIEALHALNEAFAHAVERRAARAA